ncbi:MAG: glycosyltransferase family 2 protein [Candidatus Pacebacteria bacterium]|nr:glycosyltransferase family 2 protein [Candidatus Paceibacterota bacterium]
MPISEIFIYLGTFVALYFGILIFITLYENRRRLYEKDTGGFLPVISIILPCFNEQGNVEEVLQSLVSLDYPKDCLEIIAVDDGSRDNTLSEMLAFQKKYPALKVLCKKNGGKHTALNFAIPQAKGEIIGTIDADCFAEPDALKQMLKYFTGPEVAAVVSTIKVAQPKNILEGVQYAEFMVSAFTKKMLSFLGSLTVTPGPLTLFRKETFDLVGPYKKAYMTEDLEMALRLQSHNLKIACSWEAAIYTKGKRTLKELSHQRLRWQRGFLLNLKDYLGLLNFKQHGNLSFLLAYSVLGAILSVGLMGITIFQFAKTVASNIDNAWLIKFDIKPFLSLKNLDWSLLAINPLTAMGIIALLMVLLFMYLGKRFTFDKSRVGEKMLVWIFVYPFLNAAWWVLTTASIISGKEIRWK